MRVLHVAETFKGGVATVLNSLATYQLNNDEIERVEVIVPREHISEVSPNLEGHVTTFPRKKRGVGALLNLGATLYKNIKKYNPDIVHLHSTFAGLIGRILIATVFRSRNIKVIYCPHAFAFLMDSHKLKKILYVKCEIILSRYTDKIICVGKSEYIDAANAGIPREKMVVINNGVKIPNVSNNINCNDCDEYVLLYVGRFDYQKGTDIFIDALKVIDSKSLNYRVKAIMVGESVNDNADYQNIVFKNINVIFTGWISQKLLFDYYLQANCLVIPSRWEGLAMVPLEAISYKLPVIASSISAFQEINDLSGLSFTNGDANSLATLLSNLNNHDLNRIKDILYEKVATEYTQESMNEETFSVYKNALSQEK